MPTILLTNDDGIHSPAFDVLESALAGLGDITIVAPDREMSASSQSLTLNQPLRYQKVSTNRFAVQGTPADCVILATFKILQQPPALVISGINKGLNVGDDIAYSGTVAGALEAALQGIPAISISTYSQLKPDFEGAAKAVVRYVKKVLAGGLPADVILNVNYPELWNGEVRLTRQGRRATKTVLVAKLDPRGREYFWMHEEVHQPHVTGGHVENPLTDYSAIKAGYVSVTPLHLERTALPHMRRMAEWLEI